MNKENLLYRTYIEIMERELIPAMGCTEPIAISYGAARARELLGVIPEAVEIDVSGNIIKNVKSVVVPNTGGLKGIEAAAAAGIVAGDVGKRLEVISCVSDSQKKEIGHILEQGIFTVRPTDGDLVFDIRILVKAKDEFARVRIVNEHTNIVFEEKNGRVLMEKPIETCAEVENVLTVDGILDFARTCDVRDVESILECQIQYNTAISEAGLKQPWGANIGRIILKSYGEDDVRVRAKAKAAAGSDARMSGCEMPVVINSGSGNQGITASVPVIEFAKELKSSDEQLFRALIMSNLLGLHQKAGIGRLSAYCGAVSAGCAAGAAIAYLYGADDNVIKHTIVNCLAITSGIICDGAKPSCAAKIASSVDAALLGYQMAVEGQQFKGGEGIVKKGVENTIESVGKLGKYGMHETDKEILKIMLDQ